MRILRLLVSASTFAQALDYFDDDLDSALLRMLTSNSSNGTASTAAPAASTAAPAASTAAPAASTAAPAASTAAPSNATQAPAASTAAPAASTAAPSSETSAPSTVTQAPSNATETVQSIPAGTALAGKEQVTEQSIVLDVADAVLANVPFMDTKAKASHKAACNAAVLGGLFNHVASAKQQEACMLSCGQKPARRQLTSNDTNNTEATTAPPSSSESVTATFVCSSFTYDTQFTGTATYDPAAWTAPTRRRLPSVTNTASATTFSTDTATLDTVTTAAKASPAIAAAAFTAILKQVVTQAITDGDIPAEIAANITSAMATVAVTTTVNDATVKTHTTAGSGGTTSDALKLSAFAGTAFGVVLVGLLF